MGCYQWILWIWTSLKITMDKKLGNSLDSDICMSEKSWDLDRFEAWTVWHCKYPWLSSFLCVRWAVGSFGVVFDYFGCEINMRMWVLQIAFCRKQKICPLWWTRGSEGEGHTTFVCKSPTTTINGRFRLESRFYYDPKILLSSSYSLKLTRKKKKLYS